MLSKLLIFGGVMVLLIIPKKMNYSTNTDEVVNDYPNDVVIGELNEQTSDIIVPKITPLITSNVNFYPEERLGSPLNNLLLVLSNIFILSGLALVGIDALNFLFKNKINFDNRDFLFRFFKIL